MTESDPAPPPPSEPPRRRIGQVLTAIALVLAAIPLLAMTVCGGAMTLGMLTGPASTWSPIILLPVACLVLGVLGLSKLIQAFRRGL